MPQSDATACLLSLQINEWKVSLKIRENIKWYIYTQP